jgi:SSS family solute:Na+ symporter
MNRMGIAFLILSGIIVIISFMENRGIDKNAIRLDNSIFKTDKTFNITAFFIVGILAVIYAIWW